MSLFEKLLFVVALALILIVCVVSQHYVRSKNNEWAQGCKNAGGIPFTSSDRICLHPSAVIKPDLPNDK